MRMLRRKGNPRHEHKVDCTQCGPPLCLGRCGQPLSGILPTCDDCWQAVPDELRDEWSGRWARTQSAQEALDKATAAIDAYFEGRGYDG